MSRKILVVDDEKPIANILKFNLVKNGFEVLVAYDGQEAVEIALSEKPDLMVLDVMLPKKDGFQVLREVRQKLDIPILMLTAKEEEVDKILGLELGADDYITKPFGMREIIARIKANLRRIEMSKETIENKNLIVSGDLVIDIDKYEARKNDKVVKLTLREFELLKFLAMGSEQIFTREKLLEKVWGYEYYGDIRTVDVTIRRLREKIEDDPKKHKYILTKRGIGYYFRSEK